MSRQCLFNLENYDCDETDTRKCLFVLDKKIHSTLTPDSHKKDIPECAKRIKKRATGNDKNRAGELLALSQSKPDKGINEREDKIDLDAALPGLGPNDWEVFLKNHRHAVNPFRLLLFLKDRWQNEKNIFQTQEYSKDKQLKIIKDVERILKAVQKAYPHDKETLLGLFQEIRSEMQGISQEFREKDIWADLQDLKNQKKWRGLFDYLSKIPRGEISPSLTEELPQMEELAGQGISWIEAKERFQDFAAGWSSSELDSLVKEFSTQTPVFQALFSTRTQWGNQEECEALIQQAGEFYKQCLALLKKSAKSPGQIYSFMEENQEKFQAILSTPPGEWDEYFHSLVGRLGEDFSRQLRHILETMDDFDSVRQAISGVETEANKVNLRQILQEIESVRRSLEKLENGWDFLQKKLAMEDPNSIYFDSQSLQELVEDFGKMEDTLSHWAVYRELKQNLQQGSGIVKGTVGIIHRIEALFGVLGAESGKILDAILDMDFSAAKAELDEIDRQTTLLWAANKEIRFLENLKFLVQVLGSFAFAVPEVIPVNLSRSQYRKFDLYTRMQELFNEGDAFETHLQNIENGSYVEPVELLEHFLAAVEEYRQKDFIFSKACGLRSVEIVRQIKKKIEDLVKLKLKPMGEKLTPLRQVLPPTELETYFRELEKLQAKMPTSHKEFKGYDGLYLPFKTQVEELLCLVRVHRYINGNQFEEAVRYVEAQESARNPFKNHLLACIGYYRDLDKKEWNDESWFGFFRRHSARVINYEGESETSGILEKYAMLFDENFKNIRPGFLPGHYDIFLRNLPGNNWIPYLSYLTGNSTVQDFSRIVCSGEARQVHFPRLIEYLTHHRMWPRYVEVYRTLGSRLKSQFGDTPFNIVFVSLQEEYEKIKGSFITQCTVTRERIDTLGLLIPHDQEFSGLRNQYDELVDLQNCFTGIQQQLSRYRNADIWRDKDLESRLNEIDDKCNYFSNEFIKIRKQMQWSTIIDSLKNLYDIGNRLVAKFKVGADPGPDHPLVRLETHESKGTPDFSEKMVQYLDSVLGLWGNFRQKLDKLPDEYITLQNVFEREYFGTVSGAWSKTGFWRLWQAQGYHAPGNWAEFFNMINRVLENHKEYVGKIENHETMDIEPLDIIDPYIEIHRSNQRKNRH
jgi:hypothetical protein